MKMSLSQAAAALGRSQHQVRHLIKTGKLAAKKVVGRWLIDSADLPLTEAQRQQLGEQVAAARESMDKGLRPAAKAADKAAYSVRAMAAFQVGEAIYADMRRHLAETHPARTGLFEALARVTRGCHAFHHDDKAVHDHEARDRVSAVVSQLYLEPLPGDEHAPVFADRIEQELIPKLARLVAYQEKLNRKSRFERFGGGRGRRKQ